MLKSAVILFLCTILSKILGFLRELVVAYKFGAGSISDAFVTTNRVPTILFSALSVAIGINFIPVIMGISESKKQDKFASNLINVSIILMLAGIALMICFPDVILTIFAGGLNQEAHGYAVVMLTITAFSIIPIVLSQIFQSYLQTKNRFASTGLTGIVCNVVVILFTLVASENTYQLLSVGTLISNLVMMVILIIELRYTGFRYSPVVNLKDENIKLMVILTAPLVIETLTSELNAVVDSNMASRLASGTITSLSYANNLVKMAHVMIATTIITIVFPKFSKFFSQHNIAELKKQFVYYGDVLSVALTPISLLMIVLAEPIVEFLFLRGSFDQEAAVVTGQSMIWYAIGIFPLGMKSYVIRMYYALKDTKTPSKYAVIALAINIILNFVFITPLEHIGLALSTSIASTISYLLLVWKLAPILSFDFFEQSVKRIVKILFASVVPGIVICLLYNFFLNNLSSLTALILLGSLYCVLYGLLLCFMRYYLVSDLLCILKQSFVRLTNRKK